MEVGRDAGGHYGSGQTPGTQVDTAEVGRHQGRRWTLRKWADTRGTGRHCGSGQTPGAQVDTAEAGRHQGCR